jgi:hypothetical protein
MVTDDRPKSTKTTFYCIRFFPNNDYAWLVEKDISRLKPHEITSFLSSEPDAPSKKKSSNKAGDLAEAYRIAQDPRVWVEETDRKAREALEKQAEEESGEDEEDQLESDASPSAVGKGKKRKRVSDAAGLSTASKKSKKESASTAGKKKGAAAAGAGNASAKGRNGAKKSKAAVESEDDGGHGPSASGAEDTGRAGKEPPAKRPRREDEDEAEGESSISSLASRLARIPSGVVRPSYFTRSTFLSLVLCSVLTFSSSFEDSFRFCPFSTPWTWISLRLPTFRFIRFLSTPRTTSRRRSCHRRRGGRATSILRRRPLEVWRRG